MKNAISAILLILAFLMLTGGGFEMSGMMGEPSLLWGILLALGAQTTVFAAASIGVAKQPRIGFFRALAFVFYLVQSLPIPILLFALVYRKFTHIELLDSRELAWALVASFTAFIFLLCSVRAWPFPPRKESSPIAGP